MKSLLNALQEGRLIELPDADKDASLEYLAHLIEAVPNLRGSPELAEEMIAREHAHNTGLSSGVACPHVRAAGDGELLCAVGWSPAGIDYGSADGEKVHLVVMYYIPEEQKNVYLKEISSLAGAILRANGIQSIANAASLAAVRERLLDWVQAAIDTNVPGTKVRMIRLEARQAVVDADAAASDKESASGVLQVIRSLFVVADGRTTVLCENADLAAELEADVELISLLREKSPFELSGWRFVFRGATAYGARMLYDYSAVK